MCFGYYDIGQFWLCFQIECKHVNALLTMSFVFWLDENTCENTCVIGGLVHLSNITYVVFLS